MQRACTTCARLSAALFCFSAEPKQAAAKARLLFRRSAARGDFGSVGPRVFAAGRLPAAREGQAHQLDIIRLFYKRCRLFSVKNKGTHDKRGSCELQLINFGVSLVCLVIRMPLHLREREKASLKLVRGANEMHSVRDIFVRLPVACARSSKEHLLYGRSVFG